ncbi:MAG: FAD binding domain-containing protein [Spirochaetales bacterium]|nr:FAD binding domain-containing protein [Spirochaetales bacterium]
MTENTAFHVHIPQNMTVLLNLYNKAPRSLIMAGGTHLMNHTMKPDGEHHSILAVGQLDELKKISRTDRYIELGSCVTINEMIDAQLGVASPLLLDTMSHMGPYPIRNVSTIGGNLCIPEKRMDLFPVLLLMDARMELRHVKRKRNGRASYKSRWIHINSFLDAEGRPDLAEGEILSRIRIPFYDGSFHFHRKVNIQDNDFFTINALASLDKGVLSDVRVAFTNGGLFILRSRDMEANLMGRRFPLTRKELDEVMSGLSRYFSKPENPYEEYLMNSLFRQLLESLADPSDTGDFSLQ